MISKLMIVSLFALAAAQVPEQYPAGIDPAKCPNFPICDNAFLHNSQAVPRSLPIEQSAGTPQSWSHPSAQQSQPPRHQWVSAQPQSQSQHRMSVRVSHRNTQLPTYNSPPPPPPPAPVYSHQPSNHHEPSQWTLKNLRFDSQDYYQSPASNHLPEPAVYSQPQQQRYYEPQPQQHQQQQQQQQQHYAPEQYRDYSQQSDASRGFADSSKSEGGDKYPAGVDARACPNYPFCDTNGSPHQAAAAASAPPLPGFTERLYPAGVSPQQCANFPYCFE